MTPLKKLKKKGKEHARNQSNCWKPLKTLKPQRNLKRQARWWLKSRKNLKYVIWHYLSNIENGQSAAKTPKRVKFNDYFLNRKVELFLINFNSKRLGFF